MKWFALFVFVFIQSAFAQENSSLSGSAPVPATAATTSTAPLVEPSPTPAATPAAPTATATSTTATTTAETTSAAKPEDSSLNSAPNSTDKTGKQENKKDRFDFQSYGYFSLSQYETFKTPNNLNPIVRRDMDMAQLSFEGVYRLTDTSKIEFEVEFEHGGTGTALEYDKFEEFGEFEQEVEKGGEVVIEEFFYRKVWKDAGLYLRAGKFPLYISLASVLTKPGRYPTILVSDAESRMIPYGWNETGVQLGEVLGDFTFRAAAVSGLNSEFFRTYNWVGGGYQRHFEGMNAEDIATFFNIEWGNVALGKGLALSYYKGDTTDNRYKLDKLTKSSFVTITSLFGNYKLWRFTFMGEVIHGDLQNSDAVAQANTNLGGLANPGNYYPLGSKATLESAMIAYDIMDNLPIYIKSEHVNTFEDVEENTTKDPRYDVNIRSIGLMWQWEPAAFLKAQYSRIRTDLAGLPETYQATIAFGFDLSRF
jgi:hypothetical protein